MSFLPLRVRKFIFLHTSHSKRLLLKLGGVEKVLLKTRYFKAPESPKLALTTRLMYQEATQYHKSRVIVGGYQ